MNTFIRQKAEQTDRQADKQTNKQKQTNENTIIRNKIKHSRRDMEKKTVVVWTHIQNRD